MNPALLSSPGLYPLAGTVKVNWGRGYSSAQWAAQYYCDAAGPLGYGLYLSRRPVVSCNNYDGLTSGIFIYSELFNLFGMIVT